MATDKPARRAGNMIRISISYFYGMGKTLQPIAAVTVGPLNVWWSTLYAARTTLESLFSYEWFGPAIQNSYTPGQRLLTALVNLTDQDFTTHQITPLEAYSIT